jgi:hypothetical protein
MYKWDKGINVEKIFINQSLESILFSQNTMSLHFGNNSSITVYFGFEFSLKKGEIESIGFPIRKTNILSAIGETVGSATIINETELLLVFTSGYEIIILGSNGAYECYAVQFAGKEIII